MVSTDEVVELVVESMRDAFLAVTVILALRAVSAMPYA